MSGLTDQLQSDALDNKIPVSTLLRKVKVAAAKLGLDDALSWVEGELNGYTGDVPAYRKVYGSLRGGDEYGRWVPIHISDPDLDRTLSETYLREPIGNYEALLIRADLGELSLSVPVGGVHILNEAFGWELTKVKTIIAMGSLLALESHVRNMVLDWAIELERAGILGEGLAFSMVERERAAGAHIHIGTFNGSFNSGNATGANSRIVQRADVQSSWSSSDPVFDEIAAAVNASQIRPSDQENILAAARAIKEATEADRLSAYQRFVTAAADHMSLIGPFLPALTRILTG